MDTDVICCIQTSVFDISSNETVPA